MARGIQGTFEGKVFVVTGGGTGIGAATAIACAEIGMDVLLVGRRREPLERVAARIEGLGRRGVVLPMDVAAEGASQKILDHSEAELGGFDAVFANAGYGMEVPLIHATEESIARMVEVNFMATVFLLREAGRRMVDAGRTGHLLACSSCLAKYTIPDFGLYSATKAAQNMVCRSMRFELRPHGVEVASVHPVTTRTEFFDAALENSGDHANFLKQGVPSDGGGPFVQSPERVAKAIIKCLRRPRSEVWTSLGARWVGGMFEFAPWTYDLMLSMMARRAHRVRAKNGASESETATGG